MTLPRWTPTAVGSWSATCEPGAARNNHGRPLARPRERAARPALAALLVGALFRSRPRGQVPVQVAGEHAEEVAGRVPALADGVAPVGVSHHRERLVQLDQAVHELLRPLVV